MNRRIRAADHLPEVVPLRRKEIRREKENPTRQQ
jgi:hypothetical protein